MAFLCVIIIHHLHSATFAGLHSNFSVSPVRIMMSYSSYCQSLSGCRKSHFDIHSLLSPRQNNPHPDPSYLTFPPHTYFLVMYSIYIYTSIIGYFKYWLHSSCPFMSLLMLGLGISMFIPNLMLLAYDGIQYQHSKFRPMLAVRCCC